MRPVATAERTRSVRRTRTLDQLRWRSLTSVQVPAEEREHLGPAALSGSMIVHGEIWLHPAVRCGVGLRPVAHAGLRQCLLKSLRHLRRVAAVVLCSRNIDLGFQVRREQVGAGRRVGCEIAAVKARDRPEAIRIGSRRGECHAAAHAEAHRADLPDETLLFLLASRYCDSDKLADFAWSQFGKLSGALCVQAICDFVHAKIRFSYPDASPTRCAGDSMHEGIGVCRDFAHLAIARVWAKAGADLRVPAPGQAKKVAMLGSLDHVTRQLIVHTSPTKRSSDFVAHLEQLDRLYGPKPGQPAKPVVLVEDNGPIHTSKLSLAALAARAHWLTVEWLPKYAPELNDIEVVWHDLKTHHLAHQTFADTDALDQAIHQAVDALNTERMVLPLARPRISA